MRFASAFPLFGLIAVAVQSHASLSARVHSITSIQRRDAATAYGYFLQGDNDPVTYNDISCSSGTGSACYENIQVAIEKSLESYISYLIGGTTGSGPAFGFDDSWEVVSEIYFTIPEKAVNNYYVQLFANNVFIEDLADSIISSLSSLDEIKVCVVFEYNDNTWPGGTVVLAMGWGGSAYWADPGTFQSWVATCEGE